MRAEQVVATRGDGRDRRCRREGRGHGERPQRGARARHAALADHQQARRGERAAVGREVGEVQDVGIRLQQVRREQRLQRRGERPVVDELDEQRSRPPEREHGHERDRVGELEREVHPRAPEPALGVRDLLAREAREDRGAEDDPRRARELCPAPARACDQEGAHGHGGGERGEVLW